MTGIQIREPLPIDELMVHDRDISKVFAARLGLATLEDAPTHCLEDARTVRVEGVLDLPDVARWSKTLCDELLDVLRPMCLDHGVVSGNVRAKLYVRPTPQMGAVPEQTLIRVAVDIDVVVPGHVVC